MVDPRWSVGELHRVELVDERARPVVEHIGDRKLAADAEGHVEVGEAVAVVRGERAHDGSGNDTLIRLPKSQHPLAESIALLDGEHLINPPARPALVVRSHVGPDMQTVWLAADVRVEPPT